MMGEKEMQVLDSITIENTTLCGANCKMCVRDKLKFELSSMSFELFKKAITEIDEFYLSEFGSGLKNVEYGGMGDPLLDVGLEDKLKYIKEQLPDAKQYITTTGHILDKKLDLVCKYIDTIKISNYGFSKQSYERIHGGSLIYENVKKNIDELLSIPCDKRPRCIMSFLLFPENYEEMENWKAYYEPKCEETYIWKPCNWAGYIESETVQDHAVARACGRVGKDFTIRANGDVSVCCMDFNRELTVGNVERESFSDIYYGEALKKIKLIHQEKNFFSVPNILCAKCDQLYDRQDALIYSSNEDFTVGTTLLHKTKLE